MLWKNPSTSAGFEPANLGSSGEYDNHWTTGIDLRNKDQEKMTQEINSIVDRYMSWIAQLARALARKAKGPGSNPVPG